MLNGLYLVNQWDCASNVIDGGFVLNCWYWSEITEFGSWATVWASGVPQITMVPTYFLDDVIIVDFLVELMKNVWCFCLSTWIFQCVLMIAGPIALNFVNPFNPLPNKQLRVQITSGHQLCGKYRRDVYVSKLFQRGVRAA